MPQRGVTDHDRYLFDLQGYLVIEDALDPGQVRRADAAVDALLADADPDAPTVSIGTGGGELLRADGVFLELLDNPRVSAVLEETVDPDFRLDHEYVHVLRPGIGATGLSSAVLHGGGTPFDHSQYFHFHDGRSYSGLTVVAYFLRDVNPGDGGLAVVPGSHKANLPLPPDWTGLDEPHPIVRAVTGPAGTAVVFTEALTHGTLPWRGAGERRTLFYKFSPHPVSWAWRYHDAGDFEGLTDRQRRILEAPNGRSPRRQPAQAP
jgi:ectoine hydroxylase-related dioxygenase (phytanoyl-CoA dioxygenase family)